MKPFIIGITGGSGSGKTKFIKNIIQNFSNNEVCFISQDNYYRARDDQPVDNNGVKNFDLPESIYINKFVNDLQKLIHGEKIRIREYTFNNTSQKGRMLEFKPAPVIILEGIFIFHIKEINKCINLKVFLDAREHIMLKRRIIRDKEERGYDLEDVLYRYENHVMPSFNTYILPYKDKCDIIINNHSDFSAGLDIIKAYIITLLKNKI